MKALFVVMGLIAIAMPLFWLVQNSRVATETASYKLVRSDGDVELRDYPELILATTQMTDTQGNGSFGKLFGFITGNNAKSEKIPMTTPVLINPAKTMSFVLPESLVRKGVPEPKNNDVHLGKQEPGRYAVLKFAGKISEANQQAAVQKLQTWLKEHAITAEGEPVFAYFDPPWTPGFARRNEVMIRVPSDTK